MYASPYVEDNSCAVDNILKLVGVSKKGILTKSFDMGLC